MAVTQQWVFSWDIIDGASDLDRLRMVMSAIPDEELMQEMEAARGAGCNKYPIRPMWNSLIAALVFQHPTVESLRRELSRNGALRDLCGFDPLLGNDAVPTPYAYTRFSKLLMERQFAIDEMFDRLVEELKVLLPNFLHTSAVDSKALDSYGNPSKKEKGDGRRDTDANWGCKKYEEVGDDGTVKVKKKSWFGYKLHLLIDSTYELPVAFEVTPASASDTTNLLPLVEKTHERHPELIEGCQELSTDKGYDSTANNRELYDKYGIRPLIDIRDMWKEAEGVEDKTRSLFPDRADNIVYDYRGCVSCICPETGEKRDMMFDGFEEKRRCLKYRCPAACYDFECKGRNQCGKIRSDYGRVVRIPLDTDRRVFIPNPRSSSSWEEKYKKRTAVERVNSRLDFSFGFEKHTIRGLAKMKFRVSLAMIVMLSMAVGCIKANQAYRMRSLVWSVKEKTARAA